MVFESEQLSNQNAQKFPYESYDMTPTLTPKMILQMTFDSEFDFENF